MFILLTIFCNFTRFINKNPIYGKEKLFDNNNPTICTLYKKLILCDIFYYGTLYTIR